MQWSFRILSLVLSHRVCGSVGQSMWSNVLPNHWNDLSVLMCHYEGNFSHCHLKLLVGRSEPWNGDLKVLQLMVLAVRLGTTLSARRDRRTRCWRTAREQCLIRRRVNWVWVRFTNNSFWNRRRFVLFLWCRLRYVNSCLSSRYLGGGSSSKG